MKSIETLIRGDSPAMRQVRVQIARVGPTNVPVLIQGPTGSGKELVAMALHATSGRPGSFVPFNVCAIPDSMFEDALFGHVRGAFTGAMSDCRGLLVQAHLGTAFFDEVSGLGLASQAKLLRAVETKQFRPVGARADVQSDFRLVAASNEDLEHLERGGRFRADLRHRFGKVVLRLPPLRERAEDIPLLVGCFLQAGNGNGRSISASAVKRLQSYDWPGNIRELRSVLETAAILGDSDCIDVDDVASLLTPCGEPRISARMDFVLERTLMTVRELQGDVYQAASRLGVNPTTVYRRLKRARRLATWPDRRLDSQAG